MIDKTVALQWRIPPGEPASSPIAPKVSIVTCAYNRPGLLRKAVESLRAQTDPDWEHLIFDNGSTDIEVQEVVRWAARDPRVRVWRGTENLDAPAVFWNFLMDRARGRYLTVLDDDNEKLPTFVEAMSRELDEDPALDAVTCGWRVDRNVGEPEGDYHLNLSTSATRLADLSTCDGGAILYRRTTFEHAGYFSEALRTNEDWDWMRRAAHVGRIKNLHDVHATYRSHNESRMKYADSLGNERDIRRVKERKLTTSLGLRVAYPSPSRLTQSQRDVCDSVKRALLDIPWVTEGDDLGVIVSPFQRTPAEVTAAVRGLPRVLSLHMEDPYALSTNLDRVQRMSKLTETWVCTNDAAVVPYYRKVVGDRVMICPTLGADATMPVPPASGERDIDVLLCGYAYPSRRQYIASLLPLLPLRTEKNPRGWKVVLVGDGWRDQAREGVEVLQTRPLGETYELHARAKAVICLHRTHGDCSDGPVEPATVNRGFMEGYSGARVFLDQLRSLHAFEEGDVIWYDGKDPGDLSSALRSYMVRRALPGAVDEGAAFATKCRTVFTYRERMARVLNCVRSPRYLVEIP